jgi:deoxyribose-phosphate aldolase
MNLNDKISELLTRKSSPMDISQKNLLKLVPLIDLTSLKPDDDEQSIQALCAKADTPLGKVASICVFPKFISLVAELTKNHHLKIATVVNFPTGKASLEETLNEIHYSIQQGADEIDLVFPYSDYQAGRIKEALHFVEQCKAASGTCLLKVILEISEFEKMEMLYQLCMQVIGAGADFLKTSTGRSQHGATLEGSTIMLLAIKACQKSNIGFKASGGISTLKQAISLVELAKNIMGEDWVKPENFRLGTSQLLNDIMNFKE